MALPPFTVAIVTGQDPAAGAVNVVLKSSGQSPGYPVKVLYTGAYDEMRIDQAPLPSKGTWGIVLFVYGDPRNGFWLGAIPGSMASAINSTVGAGAAQPKDAFIDHQSHWSGYWRKLDGDGNLAVQFPDGSYFTVASGTALPINYRTIVDASQVPTRVPFTQAERVPAPPSPYTAQFISVGGAIARISASGVTLSVSGSSITMDSAGTITIAGSGTVTITGATININATGHIAATGSVITLN